MAATTAQAASPAPSAPAPGPVRVIGTGDSGCIAGAVRLPDTAPGMQTVRLSRSTFWGHPDTIAALLSLARQAQQAGLPDLYMNDISNPRGGPLAGIHGSHQRGLDADVWLDVAGPHPWLPPEQRETIEPRSLVHADGRDIDLSVWQKPEHMALVRMATALPGIDRVLVNPAIKQQLCRDVTGDRTWLRRVRPWYGHSAHMHLHFRCPLMPNGVQSECIDQQPPPEGEGCDASLQWWFDQLDNPLQPESRPPPKPKPLPAACNTIMSAP